MFIRAPVIDHNDLNIGRLDSNRTPDRGLESFCGVIGRDDDGESHAPDRSSLHHAERSLRPSHPIILNAAHAFGKKRTAGRASK